ncbi:tripartite tricarboxylate transporter substrate binding protein [Alcaligenaceae bacterium]|nr:tripartite tricarboxylate transporter substrate binding protein [Alcaligenaceae bacterium]
MHHRHTSPLRRRILGVLGAGLLAAGGLAHAQTGAYPSQPVTLVVPFATGGTTSILARLLADKVSQGLGQTIVVENRPGAGGNIGMDHVARAKPDGYTLLMGPIGLAINPALYQNMTFDPIGDLEPIGLYGGVPNLLVVHPSLPVKSVAELIAYAKANPDKLNYASNGNGTSSHLAAEMLKSEAGIEMTHIPYKGGGPAMQDLVGGQVDMLFDQMPAVLPQVEAKSVVALGVSSAERSGSAPDIPAIAESIPGFDLMVWFGWLAPKGTPDEIIQRINKEMNTALADPEFQARLASMGVSPMPGTPAEFTEFLASETERWGKVVRDSGAAIN